MPAKLTRKQLVRGLQQRADALAEADERTYLRPKKWPDPTNVPHDAMWARFAMRDLKRAYDAEVDEAGRLIDSPRTRARGDARIIAANRTFPVVVEFVRAVIDLAAKQQGMAKRRAKKEPTAADLTRDAAIRDQANRTRMSERAYAKLTGVGRHRLRTIKSKGKSGSA